MSVKVEPPDFGPESLRNWGKEVAEAINQNADDATAEAFHGRSKSNPTSGDGSDSEGGSAAALQPFEIYDAGEDTVKITLSTIDGEEFGDVEVTDKVYAHITINSDGEITDRALDTGSLVPADTTTDFYRLIGNADTITNTRFGPVEVQVCRNWFSNPVTYGVTWL